MRLNKLEPVLFIFSMILVYAVIHEYTHIAVGYSFNCGYNLNLIPSEKVFMSVTPQCNPSMLLKTVQGIVDAVGYPLFLIYVLMVVDRAKEMYD